MKKVLSIFLALTFIFTGSVMAAPPAVEIIESAEELPDVIAESGESAALMATEVPPVK